MPHLRALRACSTALRCHGVAASRAPVGRAPLPPLAGLYLLPVLVRPPGQPVTKRDLPTPIPAASCCPLTHSRFLQTDILMHRWRYPSLSLHGIEGAFSGSGAKTVIPRKVIGKFSIRLVPDMTPEVVSEQACGVLGYGVGLLCTSGDLGYKRLRLRLRAAGRHKTQIFRTSGLWPTQ